MNRFNPFLGVGLSSHYVSNLRLTKSAGFYILFRTAKVYNFHRIGIAKIRQIFRYNQCGDSHP